MGEQKATSPVKVYGPPRPRTYKLRQRMANVPVLSLVLLKVCQSDSGGSLVHAEWRWYRCPEIVR